MMDPVNQALRNAQLEDQYKLAQMQFFQSLHVDLMKAFYVPKVVALHDSCANSRTAVEQADLDEIFASAKRGADRFMIGAGFMKEPQAATDGWPSPSAATDGQS